MPPHYEDMSGIISRRKPNKWAYALLITITLFTFLTFIVNLFTFLEFYYFIDFLKNSQEIKNLTHTLSHINLTNLINVFDEVKVNDIRSILGKITYNDVETFFLEIDSCIVNSCDKF